MRLKQFDLIIWGRCWKNDKGEGIFRIRRQSSIGRVDCVMSNCRKEMHLSILILSRRANIRQTTSNTFCCFEEKVHRQEKKEKVYYPPSFPVLPVCVLSSRCASDVSEVEEDWKEDRLVNAQNPPHAYVCWYSCAGCPVKRATLPEHWQWCMGSWPNISHPKLWCSQDLSSSLYAIACDGRFSSFVAAPGTYYPQKGPGITNNQNLRMVFNWDPASEYLRS